MTSPVLRDFLDGADPQLARVATRLHQSVSQAARLTWAVKWGQLTGAVDGDYHHWICGVAVTKKHVAFRLHFGALLNDPDSLLQGEGQFLRSLVFTSRDEVDRSVIGAFVKDAVSRLPKFKAAVAKKK